jgi:hypothetical protein
MSTHQQTEERFSLMPRNLEWLPFVGTALYVVRRWPYILDPEKETLPRIGRFAVGVCLSIPYSPAVMKLAMNAYLNGHTTGIEKLF